MDGLFTTSLHTVPIMVIQGEESNVAINPYHPEPASTIFMAFVPPD